MQDINEILKNSPSIYVLRQGMEKMEQRHAAKPFVAETPAQREYVQRVNNPATYSMPIDQTLFFRVVGDEMNRRGFVVRPEQERVLINLALYFSGNPSELDPKKGVFLFGGTGSGKTMFLKVMQGARARFRLPVAMANIPEIQAEIVAEGRVDVSKWLGREIILDDAGAEGEEVAAYGNKIALVPQLILLRYERPEITHMTSNLTPKEIAERPGFDDRVRSRMNEMFNLVFLPGTDYRKKENLNRFGAAKERPL